MRSRAPNWKAATPGRLPTRQWRKLRAIVLAAEPFCRSCEASEKPLTHDARSTVCDHIVNLADGGTNERENLQGLCDPCHRLKTAQEAARAQGFKEPVALRERPVIGLDGWAIE